MSLRTDQRGQAIQVGAVLLFAVLIVAFSTYQAVVVPADNRRVEFNHNQEVQDRMAELRSAMLGTASTTSTRAVTVPLGTTYPSRALGLNPNAPGGSLRTAGTTDSMVNLTIDNAEASGEAYDFWNGTTRSYNTGGIEYSPIYNGYDEAPTTVYEHSLLYNRFSDSNTLVLGNQTLVDEGRLSIVTVNGSIDRTTSRSTTVDVRPVSSGGGPVSVSATGPPITLNFSSQFPEERWDAIVPNRHTVSEGTFPSPDGFHSISIELAEREKGYRLDMAKAGVGQGVTREDAAYLIDVAGDDVPVQPGSVRELTLAVRDRYNNPVGGVEVNGRLDSAAPGSLSAVDNTSDADGEVTFAYDVPDGASTDTYPVNFTYEDRQFLTNSFNASTPTNVTMDVTVAGSGGVVDDSSVYEVQWKGPDDESANDDTTLSSCDRESCVWDVGDSNDDTLLLNAELRPPYEGIGLEFALNDSTVGSLSTNSGTSGPDGTATTELTAEENGTVDVLASANEGSDRIEIVVENVTGSSGGGGDTQPPSFDTASAQTQSDDGNNNDAESVAFTAEVSDDVGVDRVEMTVRTDNGNVVGQRTLTPPFYYESVFLDPDANMAGNQNYVTVEMTAFDVNGNERTCAGQIDEIYGSVSLNDGLQCTSP